MLRAKQTVSNIIDNFIRNERHVETGREGSKTWLARADDVTYYVENCKKKKQSSIFIVVRSKRSW